MPTHRYNTTEAVVTERGLGKASTNSLKASFAASPLYKDEWSDDAVHAFWIKYVQEEPVNDGGYMFGVHNQNYPEAPSIEDVPTGGGGLPAGPYVPTTASPGIEGSLNPADLPAVDPIQTDPSWVPGTGPGSQLSPKNASERIAKGKLGQYISGKSGGIAE